MTSERQGIAREELIDLGGLAAYYGRTIDSSLSTLKTAWGNPERRSSYIREAFHAHAKLKEVCAKLDHARDCSAAAGYLYDK